MVKQVNTVENKNREECSGNVATICPHLGLTNDPHTCVDYPSVLNCCFRCSPLAIPVLSQQRDFCLAHEHLHCKVYNADAGIKMPSVLLYQEIKQRKINSKLFLLLIPVILALGTLILLKNFSDKEIKVGLEVATSTAQNPLQTLPAQTEVEHTQTQTESVVDPTDLVTPTDEPALQPSLISTRVLNQLDKPIGKYEKFIIHKVVQGESLQQFAEDFSTSSEAIKAVNHNLLIPIWIESYIVIPFNFSDVSGLPPFSTFQVEDAALTVEDIATQFDCSVYDLLYYNNIPAGESLCYGEWLLIPREKPEY